MPKASRLARLRSIVEALPDGDTDKADLILLFTELDRVKKLHRAAKARNHEQGDLREENRRLSGALRLAQYALQVALQKIGEQKKYIDFLSIDRD